MQDFRLFVNREIITLEHGGEKLLWALPKSGMGRGLGEGAREHFGAQLDETLLRRWLSWQSAACTLKKREATRWLRVKDAFKEAQAMSHKSVDTIEVREAEKRMCSCEVELELHAVKKCEKKAEVRYCLVAMDANASKRKGSITDSSSSGHFRRGMLSN